MFTGIIEDIGNIKRISGSEIVIESEKIVSDIKIGDSIAVNGACLTVRDYNKKCFSADISPETYTVTSFKYLSAGSYVNLERALKVNGRLDGHIVSGHIDGIGRINKITKISDFCDLEIEIDKSVSKYVVKKGSITVNGISLTTAKINDSTINIAVIPVTYYNTSLKYLKIGDYVNIETDILAKYVEKFLSMRDNRTGIDMEFLQLNGF